MNKKRIMGFALSSLLMVYSMFSVCTNINASELRPPEVGQIAPSIQEKTIHGQDFDIQDLRGKVVLIDFWGTWCPPCLAELPHLKEAYKKYHDKGFEIVSIALRDSPTIVKKFTKENNMKWIHLTDDEFQLAQLFQIKAVPTPILLNHTGKIVLRGSENMFDTDLRGEQLMKDVEKYIKQIPEKKENRN